MTTKSITVMPIHPLASSLDPYRSTQLEPLHRREKSKHKNCCKSTCSHLFSIKFCLSLIIILLVLLSTISIFVSTFILQGQAIEKSSLVLGEQTMLRTYEYVQNLIQLPFRISGGINHRIRRHDSMSPDPATWNNRIDELISNVANFNLSYASFTSKGRF